jgi:hypothetical protein
MYIPFILIPLYKTCITNNHSTYVIPDAQLCLPSFNDKMDGYLFGPCNGEVLDCNSTLQKCRFAKHRDKYCFSRDAHLCSLQRKGNYSDYYQVECG